MMVKRQPGQSTVELALTLPLLMLIVAGTVEFGRAFFAYGQMLQAAQEGARYGAVLGNYTDDTKMTQRTLQLVPDSQADTVSISATTSPTNSAPVAATDRKRGNVLQVTVGHTHSVLIPFFPRSSMSLTAISNMVIE